MNIDTLIYTSRGYGCGFYYEMIFVESNDCMDAGGRATHGGVAEALKQAHSCLCNCFSNAAIGKNQQLENRNGGRAKYKYV